MSTFKVPLVKIQTVEKHPKADRLDVVTIEGWQCVTGRGQFKIGDVAVYVPIDSVLPAKLEAQIFKDSKMNRDGSGRIKTVRIREVISQGMLLKPEEVGIASGILDRDYGPELGITKYEPPEPSFSHMPGQGRAKLTRRDNPLFPKFTDLENVKWYPKLFKEGELVVLTEKIHGTNWRASMLPYDASTPWRRFLQKTGLAPRFELCWGSRQQQLQNKQAAKGGWFAKTIGKCIYKEAVDKYGINKILAPGETVFGEVYGAKVQKGYTYGTGEGERRLVIFDVYKIVDFETGKGRWLDPLEVQRWCEDRGLPAVPVLYIGAFNEETLKSVTAGTSVMSSEQAVREGVVIRSLQEAKVAHFGRHMLKSINPEYLLKDQTEFH